MLKIDKDENNKLIEMQIMSSINTILNVKGSKVIIDIYNNQINYHEEKIKELYRCEPSKVFINKYNEWENKIELYRKEIYELYKKIGEEIINMQELNKP